MAYKYIEPVRTAEQQELDDNLAAIQEKMSRIIDEAVNRRLENIEKHLSAVQNRAKELVNDHGMTDGQQHKQWVIDQLLQLILGEVEYAIWLRRHDYEAAQAGTARWDFGIAP